MTNTTHAGCTHNATPKDRAACRARRRSDIKKLQAEYTVVCDSNESEAIREYEAGVDNFAFRWNMTMEEAFDLIENGPVVI